MKVAVITDVHANLPALEAALGRIETLGMETIYCGGDLVGYGPHPNEVCALIEERAIPTIYGNYDYAIARDLDDCGCAYRDPHEREIGQRSGDWTLAQATLGNRPGRASRGLVGLGVRLSEDPVRMCSARVRMRPPTETAGCEDDLLNSFTMPRSTSR